MFGSWARNAAGLAGAAGGAVVPKGVAKVEPLVAKTGELKGGASVTANGPLKPPPALGENSVKYSLIHQGAVGTRCPKGGVVAGELEAGAGEDAGRLVVRVEAGIEIGQSAVLLGQGSVVIPAQTEGDSEVAADLPVIVDESADGVGSARVSGFAPGPARAGRACPQGDGRR